MLEFLDQALVAIVFSLFTVAAVSDARTMRIPNWMSVAIVVAFAVRAVVSPETFQWMDLAFGAGVFVVGFVFYALKGFGAGDVKLATAGALWFGAAQASDFLAVMALVGGALAILILVANHMAAFHRILRFAMPALERTKSVPYGIAIAAGAYFALFQQANAWGIV